MLKKIMVFFLIFVVSLSQAQVSTEQYEELNRKKELAQAQLNVLQDHVDNPSSAEDSFIFVMVIPSAIGATLDFILLAGAAGLISQQIQQQLEGRVRAVSFGDLSVRQIYYALKDILFIAESSVETTQRSEELLKEHGYSHQEIISLKEYVSERNQMCSNGENNNNPNQFCPDFKESFGRQGYTIEQGKGGWIVKKGKKFMCCLEWDNVHCGFEIFNKRGIHQGEVGCLPDEFDPCEANLNRGAHARAQPHNHQPRSKTCKR